MADNNSEHFVADLQFRNERLRQLENLSNNGYMAYPHKFNVDATFEQIRNKHDNEVEAGARHHELRYSVAGRVMECRSSGKNLFFCSMISDGISLQMIADRKEYIGHNREDEYGVITSNLHRGDIIGVVGFIGKSKKGELSIFATSIDILTPCLKHVPKQYYGISDPEVRARKRYLDLIANPDNMQVYKTRSIIFNTIRNYLNDRDFIEVHTPILSNLAGGANAKPFTTHHNDLHQDMFLRIAPELYLKRLVVGGLPRVYEIGPQFRNECIDQTHNPEFYSLEFYMAYADYNDLMEMCEDMLVSLVKRVNRDLTIKYTPLGQTDSININFTPPFRRIDIQTELEKHIGPIPENVKMDYSSDEARAYFDKICIEKNVSCSEPRTIARLLDKLIGEFIESQCHDPTFVINHPAIMSPLAKYHRNNSQLTERFELFVNGMEIANAYTELNNPIVQRERFLDQMNAKKQGDDEAQSIDEDFIESLEYGLPPTGGFGLGLERVVMLLTNRNNIKDVTAFPPVGKIE